MWRRFRAVKRMCFLWESRRGPPGSRKQLTRCPFGAGPFRRITTAVLRETFGKIPSPRRATVSRVCWRSNSRRPLCSDWNRKSGRMKPNNVPGRVEDRALSTNREEMSYCPEASLNPLLRKVSRKCGNWVPQGGLAMTASGELSPQSVVGSKASRTTTLAAGPSLTWAWAEAAGSMSMPTQSMRRGANFWSAAKRDPFPQAGSRTLVMSQSAAAAAWSNSSATHSARGVGV